MWQENARSLGIGRGEIYGRRSKNMRMAVEGREPNQDGDRRYSDWSSRVFTFKPKVALFGQLVGGGLQGHLTKTRWRGSARAKLLCI